jgi:hypothetical protein
MVSNKNDQDAHDALNGFPLEETQPSLKEAAAAALKELERINKFIVIDNSVIEKLKNALV